MAPSKQHDPTKDPTIERTAEYEEFIEKLAEYHEKRGTHLDREPKVGSRHIDLLRLYKRVVGEGGYDKVSDTKGNKLAWRRLASEFNPGSSNLTTQAFILKSAYYKNLAAYEITHVHKREPPPKEILEDVSAKGGDLLNRTRENYFRPASRETERLRNGDDDEEDSDEEGSIKRTPKQDKMDIEEAGSTGGRVTRALRNAPPQRQLFQPEMSARQTRQSTGHMNSPQPHTNGNYGTSAAAATIANYEPQKPPHPATVKPVLTPANNPEYFRQLRLKHAVSRKNKLPPTRGMMLPGTGFPGPNIYIRALHALRSKLPEEQAYALHHLVKISHERGDKYQFNQFPGLAEALIEKVVEVASIFYDVKFEISYVDEEVNRPNALNGLSGTSDLIERIQSLELLDMHDDLVPEHVAKSIGMVNEAALIIRNMVMLPENAMFISMLPTIRDMMVIALNLPKHALVVELQHYVLDIAEQLTRFWVLDAQDPLYRSLLAQIDSDDRGRIATTLRALGRIAMNLQDTIQLTGVPKKTLRSICDLLLVEDEDLRNACLDFLYLFTGFVDNVEILANETNIEGLVIQLVRLLQYNAVTFKELPRTTKPTRSSTYSDNPPKLSDAIIQQLVTLAEPERSAQWLRTCFEEDISGDITQIQLWSAYNAAFQEIMNRHPEYTPLMPAKEFITNVSTTFTGASAQVINSNGQQKYTIRGIRPRSVPVDPTTKKPYMRCCWYLPSLMNGYSDTKHSAARIECGEFASGTKAMWEHILSAHLKIPRDEAGKWLLDPKPDINMENSGAIAVSTPKYFCHWGDCTHFDPNGTSSGYEAGQHVKTHLPDTNSNSKHNRTPSTTKSLSTPAQYQPQFGQPVGLGSLGMGGRNSENYNYSQTYSQNGMRHEPAPPPPPPILLQYYNTMTDETGDAAGLPLASVLVLRNLARQLAKLNPPASIHEVPDSPSSSKRGREDSSEHRRSTGAKKPRLSDASNEAEKENEERGIEEMEDKSRGWVPRVFAPVRDQLYYVMAHNFTLKHYMAGLLKAVSDGGG